MFEIIERERGRKREIKAMLEIDMYLQTLK